MDSSAYSQKAARNAGEYNGNAGESSGNTGETRFGPGETLQRHTQEYFSLAANWLNCRYHELLYSHAPARSWFNFLGEMDYQAEMYLLLQEVKERGAMVQVDEESDSYQQFKHGTNEVWRWVAKCADWRISPRNANNETIRNWRNYHNFRYQRGLSGRVKLLDNKVKNTRNRLKCTNVIFVIPWQLSLTFSTTPGVFARGVVFYTSCAGSKSIIKI